MGFDVNKDSDIEDELGDEGVVEGWLDDLMPTGPQNGDHASLAAVLAEALAQLEKGENKLIDALNEANCDYWNEFVHGHNPRGLIAAGGTSGNANGTQGENNQAGWRKEAEKWVAGGIVVLAAAIGGLFGGGGAAAGAAVGEVLGEEYADDIVDVVLDFLGLGAPVSDDTGTTGSAAGYMPHTHPAGVLMPTIKRKVMMEFTQNIMDDDDGPATGQNFSTARVVQTDTGAMVIVNFSELAQAARLSGERGVSVGLNPLTGTAILIPGKIDGQAIYESAQMSYWLNPVGRPLEA